MLLVADMFCFQGLLFCPEASSLLLHNFCIYHISPLGHEVGNWSLIFLYKICMFLLFLMLIAMQFISLITLIYSRVIAVGSSND